MSEKIDAINMCESRHVAGIICRLKTSCGPDAKNSLEISMSPGSALDAVIGLERPSRTHFKSFRLLMAEWEKEPRQRAPAATPES